MDLIGIEFEFMDSGMSYIKGWIRPDSPEGFLVPPVTYNPLKGATRCKECKGKDAHVIVDEGFYVPEINQELWEKVRGCVVDIRTGPYSKGEDLDE